MGDNKDDGEKEEEEEEEREGKSYPSPRLCILLLLLYAKYHVDIFHASCHIESSEYSVTTSLNC